MAVPENSWRWTKRVPAEKVAEAAGAVVAPDRRGEKGNKSGKGQQKGGN